MLGKIATAMVCVALLAVGAYWLDSRSSSRDPDGEPETGFLEVTVAGPAGLLADRDLSLTLSNDAGRLQPMERLDNGVTSGPLPPGHYRIQVRGSKIAAAAHAVEVRSLETARVQIPLTPGVRRTLMFIVPVGEAPPDRLKITVRDAAGDAIVVAQHAVASPSAKRASYWAPYAFRPGRYTYEATAASGLGATGEFEITAEDSKSRVLTVTLERL